MLFDLNFEARFGILLSFSIFLGRHLIRFSHFEFFDLPYIQPIICIHLKINVFEKFFWIVVIDVQRHQNTTRVTSNKKVDK